MSSSTRLSKLKRSVNPMVSDVNNTNVRTTQSNTNNVTNTIPQRNMVEPMTVLTWHEQRLNKIDEMLKNLKSPELNQAEVVVPIVESIEVLESHIKDLQRQVDDLRKNQKLQKNQKKNSKSVKEEVKESLSQLKLDIKEKS